MRYQLSYSIIAVYCSSFSRQILEFQDLERDQLVCVSVGEAFTKAKEVHAQVEVRANWGRARRMYGAKATEVAVLSRPNAAVGVDPFGPPGLVRRPDPPPSFENVSRLQKFFSWIFSSIFVTSETNLLLVVVISKSGRLVTQ